MKHVFIILGIVVIFLLFRSAGRHQSSYTEQEETSLVILSHTTKTTSTPGEYTVIAEVKNTSDKPIKYASVNITWRDKGGNVIDSGTGMGKNIMPHSTKTVDYFFTNIPKGATYSVDVE